MIWILRNIGKQGQSLLEYSLAAGLIALVCVGALSMLGGGIKKGFIAIIPPPQEFKALKTEISTQLKDTLTEQTQGGRVDTNHRDNERLDKYKSIVQTAGSLGDEKMVFAYSDQLVAYGSKFQDENPEVYNWIVEQGIRGKQMAKVITKYQQNPKNMALRNKLDGLLFQYFLSHERTKGSPEFRQLSSQDQIQVLILSGTSHNLTQIVINSKGAVQNADVEVDQHSGQIIVCGQNMKCD